MAGKAGIPFGEWRDMTTLEQYEASDPADWYACARDEAEDARDKASHDAELAEIDAGSDMVCLCGEAAVAEPPTDMNYGLHALEPQWSHTDGTSLCPVPSARIGLGSEPAQPITRADAEADRRAADEAWQEKQDAKGSLVQPLRNRA